MAEWSIAPVSGPFISSATGGAAWTYNHMEWAYVPELCVLTDGALSLTLRVLRGLRVHPERMRRNADALQGLMMSEAVMFALGQFVGKQTAHDIVYECAMQSIEHDTPFRQLLLADPAVAKHLTAEQIDALLDPARYTGLAARMAAKSLAGSTRRAKMWR